MKTQCRRSYLRPSYLPHQNRETKNILTGFKCLNLEFLLEADHITDTDTKKTNDIKQITTHFKVNKEVKKKGITLNFL